MPTLKKAVKKAAKPAPEKRIPAGTKVSWKTPGFNGPTWTGTVMDYEPAFKTYRVSVTAKNGKDLKAPKVMLPYAKRIHEQNPGKLRVVK